MLMNSKDIIKIRKSIDFDITKYWRIIRSENIMSEKARDAKMGSCYDLKMLLNEIHQLAAKRIKLKLMLQAINLNLKDDKGHIDFNKIGSDTNYETIFRACELKEELSQLSAIHTLTPKMKSNKNNKLIEIFDAATLGRMKHALIIKINKQDKMLEDFNNNTFIDMDIKKEGYSMYLAA